MTAFGPALDRHFTDTTTDGPQDGRCVFERDVPCHTGLPLAVRREYYACGQHAGPHCHTDFFALYVVRAGRGVHRIDGTPYGVSRGDVYLLAPGSTHGYLEYRDLVIDACYFPYALLEGREIEALREMPGFWQLFVSGGEANVQRRLHLSPALHHDIETQIEELRAEYGRTNGAAVVLLRANFLRLLVGLARLHEEGHETGVDRGLARPLGRQLGRAVPFGRAMELADVRRWCEESRGEAPTVAQLAGMMWLSSSQFRVVWKRETGVAPAIYLRRLRLERARLALSDRRQSIAQVARDAGFADAAHFSRAFRSVYSQSPREYRQSRK